ncbi:MULTISPECIES: hypothetical protein [unclassified Flavobacterium]|uniref:hypothetical protein n=1 Tax=unclassified Flavobacterium TaxID=196869 RepID=UPI00086A49FC|nr:MULTISPECIES: hypothetical protein [unclassified Flavobacterium]MBN9283919.1 hypothetical protein [Flavobacterium sp.]ODS90370.1 MAG: hypothetical protein ABS44_00925 [Chryseobacterium sp. SCN 40-13]OJV73421.1 MAG: hypothetical protein BGO42_09685 [Flavobacterium sp. 40-81]
MKLNFITFLILFGFTTSISFSQCNIPVTFPASNDLGAGGTFCLDGSPDDSTPSRKICFENLEGNLNLIYKEDYNNKLFSFFNNGTLKIGDKTNNSESKLIIQGPGLPVGNLSRRDISFEFSNGGSAKVRSFRGNSWETTLQFLTNSAGATGDTPSVRMQIGENGNVGIGTVTPSELLEVNGNVKINSNYFKFSPATNTDAVIQRTTSGNLIVNSGGGTSSLYLNFSQGYGAGNNGVNIFDGGSTNFAKLWITKGSGTGLESVGGNLVISPSGGRVIISDITNTALKIPDGNYKLIVQNGILTDKVKVAVQNSTNWSDFVFDKDHNLVSLYEVEKYILKNRHLPNIPSAEKLIKDGLDIAEMQARQMEKIEELTLYLIEMRKEIDSLKKENLELRNMNSK